MIPCGVYVVVRAVSVLWCTGIVTDVMGSEDG